MTNYQKVAQWAATINAEKAKYELDVLKLKYPWLRCEESLKFVTQMYEDMPKILEIIKQQEKQNAMHRRFIEVSRLADEAIVKAVEARFSL